MKKWTVWLLLPLRFFAAAVFWSFLFLLVSFRPRIGLPDKDAVETPEEISLKEYSSD